MTDSNIDLIFGPILVARPGLTISNEGPNPGIGGTEFQTALLALQLARSESFRSVTVAQIRHTLEFEGGDVRGHYVEKVEDFYPPDNSIVVLPATSLIQIPTENLLHAKVIVRSHHPHDKVFSRAQKRHETRANVSTGRYAFHSNGGRSGASHLHIPDLFWPPQPSDFFSETLKVNDLIVGHVSSLHPVKGFLDVAKAWPAIKKDFPNASMEVVGGGGLWGIDSDNHPTLPMELHYGNQVLQALGEHADSVKFLGRLDDGVDETIRRWTIGILNPRALDEADPASLKDFIRAGVPAMAGYDFGMVDYLSSFKDLRITDPDHIPQVFARLARNKALRHRLSGEFVTLSKHLTQRNELILEVWKALIQSVSRGDSLTKIKKMTRPFFSPPTPLGHRVKILMRRRVGIKL